VTVMVGEGAMQRVLGSMGRSVLRKSPVLYGLSYQSIRYMTKTGVIGANAVVSPGQGLQLISSNSCSQCVAALPDILRYYKVLQKMLLLAPANSFGSCFGPC
jgi:hypothetical protein